jgi:hypothetical protein
MDDSRDDPFRAVDIRAIPDDQLDDIFGGSQLVQPARKTF